MNVIAKDIKNTKLELARKFAEELVGDYDTARLILTLSDQVEALTKERDALEENHKECVRCLGEALQDTTNLAVERDALAAEVVRLDAGWHDANGDTLDKALELDNVKAAAKLALDALEDCRDVLYQVAHGNQACSDAEGVGSTLPDVFEALKKAGVQ